LASESGAVTGELVEHYVRRSAAVGLVIVEHSYVAMSGRMSAKQLGIHDDSLISGLERLAGSVHAAGTPVMIQLNHAGAKAVKEVTGVQPVGPSASETVRGLSEGEIESLCDSFGEAAYRAVRAGFDGVEIHGAHGFLLNQFSSPLTNRRRDEYGRSPANRVRFPLMVVEKVKAAVGGRILSYRLGSDDLDANGTRVEDSIWFAKQLEKAGVDTIDVSGGVCGSRPEKFQGIQGYFVNQAAAIKKAVSVPVVGVGGITDAVVADGFVRERKVDLVAVGRALLEDAGWAVKAVESLKAA
jgi:2,4-dienoyl-CoA reductase-like NADH-dependent reductase (Old Yellow Enzyme family)